MTSTIIKEHALNDDVLHIADDRRAFSGGYKAILEYFTYANEWGDRRHIRRFKTVDNANKYIAKHYGGDK